MLFAVAELLVYLLNVNVSCAVLQYSWLGPVNELGDLMMDVNQRQFASAVCSCSDHS